MTGTGASGPVEGARLAAALRELRGRTGLSLAALATKTAYSKSSWERYLNGKALPPREAVEALCRLAGERGGRVVALWELADAAWSGRGRAAERECPDVPGAGVREGVASPPEEGGGAAQRPEDVPRSAPPFGVRRVTLVTGVAVVLVVAAVLVVVLAVVLESHPGAGGADRQANTAVSSAPSARTGCHGAACDGQDPLFMLCGGEGLVTTVLRHTATGGRHLQIRYSKACGAAWGRLRGGRIGDRLAFDAPGGRPQSTRVTDRFDADGYVFTPMAAASGPEKLRVCLRPAGGGRSECFRTG
ncbi:XRE family transcriptional regulator [Streptomyces rimosus]|uniref:helix-turn-helix domain-containing protein n=1 Tax=Streptomyces rimosus TaxID=1927 RepID=UPI0004C4B57D|nr:XRE family transcriptional regulator [Streptomyces rimosus]